MDFFTASPPHSSFNDLERYVAAEDVFKGDVKDAGQCEGDLRKATWPLFHRAISTRIINPNFSGTAVSRIELWYRPQLCITLNSFGNWEFGTVGKLTCRLKSQGATILMAAGDTFRAAASDQLGI
ncbi:hypothetical protein L2E82_00762 [Cichorium intybus]|uniref:Uncharacterized protein n=1 Tax=Cichorium intybus TaxID=13427 RepID=A0ACB9GX98_CICIN|nr:hypothetical protein L2E82_00762 [Cichorium intybus]